MGEEGSTEGENEMAPHITIDRSWTKALEPGQNFIWFDKNKLTFYSTILQTEEPKEGYYWTRSFNYLHPDGFDGFVRNDLPAQPLTQEQLRLARILGWPDGEEGIRKVLFVESS
jgi:hypothetical protein